MAGRNVTFTFDSGIEKIMWGGVGTASALTNEIAASPSTIFSSSQDVYAKPILKNGYIIDTAIGAISQSSGVYHINAFEVSTVSFTSKLGEDSTMKSYDLSTSTKWDSLSAGNHSVTIIAKASGYKDSVSSTAVTVVKSSAGETWLLNSTLTDVLRMYYTFDSTASESAVENGSGNRFTANFESNGKTYYFIGTDKSGAPNRGATDYADLVYESSSFKNEAYRTITFDSPVTDSTLLTWLQANGTKQ